MNGGAFMFGKDISSRLLHQEEADIVVAFCSRIL